MIVRDKEKQRREKERERERERGEMETAAELVDVKGVTVAIHDTSLVPPASPSPQPFLLLSPFDAMLRDYTYNRRVLFYDRPANGRDEEDDYALFLSTLQSSLSRVLAIFYPFAGRLVKDPPDERCTVACNDEGAELVQASIHGVSFADLQSSNFDMKPYFVHLTRWAHYSRLHHEGFAPLLSIQVTRFPCGSIAMGIAHSHVLADGFSLWHFMSSWAECARGETLSLYPSFDRTPLILESPSLEDANFECFKDEGQTEKNEKVEVIKQRVFSFSKDMVENLKKRANNKFGSYEVVCAHIWKSVTKAQAHESPTVISFGNVVNMRSRLEPPLPCGYFGNVLLWGIATTTMGELQQEDLAGTATRIRKAVGSCSHERMQKLLNFVQLRDTDSLFQEITINEFRMRVSSSPKFPVMSTDFGWGRPLAVRSVVVEESGKLVFYPGAGGIGSVDVCLALPYHIMYNLENDSSFLLHSL